MVWEIDDLEYASILKLSAQRRYQYFVKRVADWKEIWSLKDTDGWTLVGDEEGQEAVPVWPHARFAEGYANENGGGKAKSIDLDAWRERWLPGLARDHRLIAVFPTPDSKGPLCDASIVQNDIDEAVSRLE